MSVQLEVSPLAVFPNQELTHLYSYKRAWALSFPTFQAICHQRLVQIFDTVLPGQAGLVGYSSQRSVLLGPSPLSVLLPTFPWFVLVALKWPGKHSSPSCASTKRWVRVWVRVFIGKIWGSQFQLSNYSPESRSAPGFLRNCFPSHK